MPLLGGDRPEYAVRTFTDGNGVPSEAEELFAKELAYSREEDGPDPGSWRFLLTCAVTPEGGVLGGVHMDAGPVGFGPLKDDMHAILEKVFVRPERRRQGVGAAVLRGAVEAARAAGCRHIRCNVPWNSPEEIALFRRCGFALVCFEDGEYFVVKSLAE